MKRVSFALKHIDANGAFQNMYDHVHIDEKWFYMFKLNKRLYLHPAGKPLPRKCVNKRHRKKVMFLAAVARPRYNYRRHCWFDGLIGIWYFAEKVVAQRSSINWPAGTIELVVIDKVTNKEHKEMLVKKVIPAIKAMFLTSSKKKPIYIQLDNAGPPTLLRADKVNKKLSKEGSDGWDIKMKKKTWSVTYRSIIIHTSISIGNKYCLVRLWEQVACLTWSLVILIAIVYCNHLSEV